MPGIITLLAQTATELMITMHEQIHDVAAHLKCTVVVSSKSVMQLCFLSQALLQAIKL